MVGPRTYANTVQSGLCDISIAADNSAAPIILPAQTRPPKRPFVEVDEDAVEDPNSDVSSGALTTCVTVTYFSVCRSSMVGSKTIKSLRRGCS
jgi:hypothetical protein